MQQIPGEDLVIDRKARLSTRSVKQRPRPPTERKADFGDTFLPSSEADARRSAERCIHCPDPAGCYVACPLHNDIPSAMWLIEIGDFVGASAIYRQTSSLPQVCSRVCPVEQLCAGSCVRSKSDEPVLAAGLEAFVADYGRRVAGMEIPPAAPVRKRIAMVGAGPASFSFAEPLLQRGHWVTVFEALPSPGGLLLCGIPNFKLNKSVLRERLEDFRRANINFVTDTQIGKDKKLEDLLAQDFDAVFACVGSQVGVPLQVPGADLPGVYQAADFLIRANVDPDLLPIEKRFRPIVGRNVAVIGAGDTASDCLRTALRMGAEKVICLYRRTEAEMPGGKKDRELAREEGAQFRFLTQPIRFLTGPDGRVSGVERLQCRLGEPDKSGRRRPIPIEGSNFIVTADTVILASGYRPDHLIGDTTAGLETRDDGLIVVDKETGATTKPGVFAGGDDVTGPDLVVTAVAAGRRAAQAVHQYVMAKASRELAVLA